MGELFRDMFHLQKGRNNAGGVIGSLRDYFHTIKKNIKNWFYSCLVSEGGDLSIGGIAINHVSSAFFCNHNGIGIHYFFMNEEINFS
ncbi:MAG: hypothetical protein C4527_03620 [Candidatus Omnitrophota bacterium]|nr:MAG: hypothetical protein C4527_03620 [Candidatus Omnitrophota bacterium]